MFILERTVGWTAQDVLTVIIAGSSALFALGAMIAAFVATSQTHLGGPGYRLVVSNVGQTDAHDMWVSARMPDSRTWSHVGYRASLPPHTPWELQVSLVDGTSSEVHLFNAPNHAGAAPKRGRWKWKVELQSSFDPNRKERVSHSHRVTEARYAANRYTSVG
jgi:hypothetical protein